MILGLATWQLGYPVQIREGEVGHAHGINKQAVERDDMMGWL